MTSAESVKMAAVPTRLRRRAAAWAIDYLLTMTVMLALVAGGLLLLLQDIPGYAGGVAVDAGWEALKLAFHGGHGAAANWARRPSPNG